MDTTQGTGMTLIGDVLFPPADYRRTTLSLLSWWESRRFTYNVIVGASGLFSLTVIKFLSLLPPGIRAGVPWQGVVAFGVAANVCYTFGWSIEVALKRLMGDRAPYIGPALFRQGIAFSVGLSLLPTLFASAQWLIHAGAWLLGR